MRPAIFFLRVFLPSNKYFPCESQLSFPVARIRWNASVFLAGSLKSIRESYMRNKYDSVRLRRIYVFFSYSLRKFEAHSREIRMAPCRWKRALQARYNTDLWYCRISCTTSSDEECRNGCIKSQFCPVFNTLFLLTRVMYLILTKLCYYHYQYGHS